MNKGEPINVTGFVTQRKYLSGKTLEEMERILGFSKKRFGNGVIVVALQRMPEEKEFELAGYSQVAGHHTADQFGSDLQTRYDMGQLTKVLQQQVWSLSGSNQLVKVLVNLRHSNEMEMNKDYYYPPGSGIPQWKIKDNHPVPAVVIDAITEYPSGKFS